jgi:hypothetical protein
MVAGLELHGTDEVLFRCRGLRENREKFYICSSRLGLTETGFETGSRARVDGSIPTTPQGRTCVAYNSGKRNCLGAGGPQNTDGSSDITACVSNACTAVEVQIRTCQLGRQDNWNTGITWSLAPVKGHINCYSYLFEEIDS